MNDILAPPKGLKILVSGRVGRLTLDILTSLMFFQLKIGLIF